MGAKLRVLKQPLLIFGAAYLLYRIVASANKSNENIDKADNAVYVPFACKTASAEEIRNQCLKLGKSDEYADFMVMAFRSGKTQKEIGAILNLAESTVRKYKRLRAAELEGCSK